MSNGSILSPISFKWNFSNQIHIVAAENFWGSLVSQLGGTRVQVFSIVTDPNADPHEYESKSADARAVATANYVIMNGAGYDDWMTKLLSAGSLSNQKVLNVASILHKSEGDNPHFWYSPYYVNSTVHQMYLDLISIDQNGTSYYTQQYAALNQSLGTYNQKIDQIKARFSGTKVASTESIFVYLANATGLNLVSPPAFMQAVSEGNDPSSQDVITFTKQLENGTAKMLVYNNQTVTDVTTNMQGIAIRYHVPIVGITETIVPPTEPFQDWMNAELTSIQTALQQVTAATGH